MVTDLIPSSKVGLQILIGALVGFATAMVSASPPDGNCYSARSIDDARQFKDVAIRFVREEAGPSTQLAGDWDWRAVGGASWLTKVRSQSACGDCVMHAVTSVFESQLKIQTGLHWYEPQISVAEGFHCGGGVCSTGWDADLALARGTEVGFLDESCGARVTSPEACGKSECSEAHQRRWKIRQVHTITSGTLDVQAIRRALMRGPVLTGMALYPDFACYHWGVYHHMDGKPPRAGHMLAIVGYSLAKRAWIVKNSWGEKWAYQGYGYVYDKDSSGIGLRSWQLEVEDKSPAVMIDGLVDNELLKGQSEIRALAVNGVGDFKLFLQKGAELREIANCNSDRPCLVGLDAKVLDPGIYEISARKDHSSPAMGFPVFFRVESPSTPLRAEDLSGEASRTIPMGDFKDGEEVSALLQTSALRTEGKRAFVTLVAELRDSRGRVLHSAQTKDIGPEVRLYVEPWARPRARTMTLKLLTRARAALENK